MVARLTGGEEVAGSNPVVPTIFSMGKSAHRAGPVLVLVLVQFPGIVAVPVSLLIRNILRGVLRVQVLLIRLPGLGGIGFLVEVEALLFTGVIRRGVVLPGMGILFLPGMAIISESEIAFLMMVSMEGIVIGVIVVVFRVVFVVVGIVPVIMLIAYAPV